MNDKKRRMLIVDDEIETLKVLREVFELRDWEVITTPTGATVWTILEKEKVDIILLDIRLPDGSGIDVLRDLKHKFSAIPVIIYTAYSYEDDSLKEAIKLGASGYVSKSVPITELMEVVNNTLIK